MLKDLSVLNRSCALVDTEGTAKKEEATNEKDPIFDDDKTPEDEVKTPLMIRLTVMMMMMTR